MNWDTFSKFLRLRCPRSWSRQKKNTGNGTHHHIGPTKSMWWRKECLNSSLRVVTMKDNWAPYIRVHQSKAEEPELALTLFRSSSNNMLITWGLSLFPIQMPGASRASLTHRPCTSLHFHLHQPFFCVFLIDLCYLLNEVVVVNCDTSLCLSLLGCATHYIRVWLGCRSATF